MSAEDFKYMSSSQQIKRFSQYLNHTFYVGADLFLRTKHKQFLKLQNPKKVETVFDRLEKDKK